MRVLSTFWFYPKAIDLKHGLKSSNRHRPFVWLVRDNIPQPVWWSYVVFPQA